MPVAISRLISFEFICPMALLNWEEVFCLQALHHNPAMKLSYTASTSMRIYGKCANKNTTR